MSQPSMNDELIRALFEAVVPHKASLRYLLAAAEETGEPLDVRKMAAEIVTLFPWPVGVELRRLFSGAMQAQDRARLDQLLKTMERIMQFLAFVLLRQAVDESARGVPIADPSFRKEFPRRFTQLTMGNLTWLIQSLGRLFSSVGIEPFLPELKELLQTKFYHALNFWAPERNEIGHYLIHLSQEEIEIRCVEYTERLRDILVQLAFLVKYPLLTVTDVSVRKFPWQEAIYQHRVLLLNSMSSDFQGDCKEYAAFTDTHAVLLISSLKDAPRSFLNLSPLVIDTHAESLDTRDKIRTIRKDIFLYSKWHDDKLHYVGTEATEQCDLRTLSFYGQLVAQFERILRLAGPESAS